MPQVMRYCRNLAIVAILNLPLKL